MGYQQKLTDVGRDIVALTQAGARLTFTRLVLGRGTSTLAEIAALTALKDPVMDSGIADVSPGPQPHQVTVTSKVPVASIPQSFWLNEVGLFARADTGPEGLYCVAIADSFPESMSPTMAGATSDHTISLAVLVGTTEDVTAVFDPDIACANIAQPGVYARRDGNTFKFKQFIGSETIAIAEDANTVRFNVPLQVPSGGMMPYAGAFSPPGWLLCNGAWYPKTQYPALASVLGNIYGGDANNFAVPNCVDRTLVGAGVEGLGASGGARTHTLSVNEMPNHNHQVFDWGHSHSAWSNPHDHSIADPSHVHYLNTVADDWFREGTGASRRFAPVIDYPYTTTYQAYTNIRINAATVAVGIGNSGTGITLRAEGGSAPHNNMPPYLVINWIIRV